MAEASTVAEACRKEISLWWGQKKVGSNAGLLRDRFLKVAVKDKKNHPDARRDLFEAMCLAIAQSKETYAAAYYRQESALKNLKSKGLFSTDGRMVIGLGGENVLETGLTLNHTYGTPMIPGTALKGLAAHYCHQAWGAADEKFKLGGEHHQTIFGTTEDSGHIIFHDAWITPQSLDGSLQLDVMTPHHGEYYSDKNGLTPPTDFEDPNPVTFLSVVGTFHVAVSCDVSGPDGDEWAERIFGLLSDALREWGIGGKTNAGYGRLVLEGSGGETKLLKTVDSLNPLIGLDVVKPLVQPRPTVKKTKHSKGEIVEVTRVPDPNERRGKPYFAADDGVGGAVTLGTPPSVEMGQKARLEIKGVMEKEGRYDFAAVGAKRETRRQPRERKERR